MKRFAFFAGCDYYPVGGARDFLCFADEVPADVNTIVGIKDGVFDWINALDMETGAVVCRAWWSNSEQKFLDDRCSGSDS